MEFNFNHWTELPMNNFLAMVERQFAASDFDAEHPTTMWLSKMHTWPQREQLWMCFLYMAFYDEASSWVCFHETDPFTVPRNVTYPIGMNRRNLFGGKIVRHFESLCAIYRSTPGWPLHNLSGSYSDWEQLKINIGAVWGDGRFAQYTTAEMIQKVMGLPIEITGFDNKNSSGPADGIHRISGCARHDIDDLDMAGETIYKAVLASGHTPGYVPVDRGVVESVLCNYSGMCRGKYYSGRNLDRQQARILRVEEQIGKVLTPLWEARTAVFQKRFLGEHAGWTGINTDRLLHYQHSGEILWAHEKR